MVHDRATPCDFLVVGGGIVGLTISLEVRRRWTGASVVLLEKEDRCGRHASGRNSGVLHAGFYYDEDSLKARLTRTGNQRLTRYCLDRGLPIDRCGKLVVTRSEAELPWLVELARRGRANGVELVELDDREAARIEPRVRTVERALFSPSTAIVAPEKVVSSLAADARQAGVEVVTTTRYTGRTEARVQTSRGSYEPGFFVNAAGLYADRVARDFGFGADYRILPFKGHYLKKVDAEPGLRTHVYPVPDLRYPFLGVHFTRTVEGGLKIGPTAQPAFWREQYHGLNGFHLGELLRIGVAEARLFASDPVGFRRLAVRELRKHSKRAMLRAGRRLAREVADGGLWEWGEPGIRAQLFDIRRQRLVDDFTLEGDARSLHVLNAVSPAFTCALPFAELVVDRIDELMSGGEPTRASGAARGQRKTADQAGRLASV